MRKSKPHFERVPLEVVEKILEGQTNQPEIAETELLQESPKDTQDEARLKRASNRDD